MGISCSATAQRTGMPWAIGSRGSRHKRSTETKSGFALSVFTLWNATLSPFSGCQHSRVKGTLRLEGHAADLPPSPAGAEGLREVQEWGTGRLGTTHQPLLHRQPTSQQFWHFPHKLPRLLCYKLTQNRSRRNPFSSPVSSTVPSAARIELLVNVRHWHTCKGLYRITYIWRSRKKRFPNRNTEIWINSSSLSKHQQNTNGRTVDT